MTLSLDTAYRSFGGEVEASSTPTICRLSDSRRYQLAAIAQDPPQDAERMVDVEAQYPRRVCELGEVRGDPRNGQQQRSHWSTSRRAQAWRRAAGRSDPVQALRPQAHTPLLRHEAPYPALQLQPRLDGQWRPSLHRLRRIARR